ncbi:peptidase [Citrobacter koseri]|uniref:Peptidase n=1 Tax=Citrobacter koseri TaxID=545 RepID=A0A2X2XRB3_CITKO|nr:peptidase [Citrobacter koseri]
MRWQGRRESDNVEDRRNSSGGPSMGGPGFRLPSGKGGIILLIVVLVAGYYGVDLTGLMTGQPISQQETTRSISPNDDEAAKFTSVILATTEDTWGQQFEKMGRTYQQPKLVMYRGATRTGCGAGQSVMGPFYCPADGTVYIDLSFYDDMKNKTGRGWRFCPGLRYRPRSGAPCAKTVGHRTEGPSAATDRIASGSEPTLRTYGATGGLLRGRLGHNMQQQGVLESGDLEEALNAAQAIGDDRLQPTKSGTRGAGQLHSTALPSSAIPGLNAVLIAAIRHNVIPSAKVFNIPGQGCLTMTHCGR